MEISNIYLFHVQPQGQAPYMERYVNAEQYWQTVRDAQSIIEARVPAGSTVSYYGTEG